MGIYSRGIDRSSLLLVFAFCVFPIHVWTLLSGFFQLSAWTLRFSLWDLVGIFSYLLLGALLESLALAGLILALAFVLPAGWLRQQFALRGSALGLLISIGSAASLSEWVRFDWPLGGLEIGFVLAVIAVFAGSFWLLHRFERAARYFLATGERILVLSLVYLAMDIAGVLIVIVRNLGGA